jgi:hypothetical protein
MPRLREKLRVPGAVLIAAELVTNRGLMSQPTARSLHDVAHQPAADGRFALLSITDNAGGNASVNWRKRPIGVRVLTGSASSSCLPT